VEEWLVEEWLVEEWLVEEWLVEEWLVEEWLVEAQAECSPLIDFRLSVRHCKPRDRLDQSQ
jgi:hypothetical protein